MGLLDFAKEREHRGQSSREKRKTPKSQRNTIEQWKKALKASNKTKCKLERKKGQVGWKGK